MESSLRQKLVKNRALFEDLVKRKFIYAQTAEIYGGSSGLYDYGPIGSGIKTNLINKWKRHFIVEEDLLEISCTTLTPRVVLKNSGHEKRFIDWMVKDEKTLETFRADHLLEDYIELKLQDKKLTEAQKEELSSIYRSIPDLKTGADFDVLIEKFNITNPKTKKKNKLSKTYAFNLMFSCAFGPLGDQICYLRPETAQHIFTNFQKLLSFNNGTLPFGGAMIGSAYRNEIAPRNGLLRVREFEMAEIEYFIDPQSKKHPKFDQISHLVVPIYDRATQEKGPTPRQMTISDAVSQEIIANEMIGYFLGRIYLFMMSLGINKEMIRFRQHLSGEMAHYATDCWDTELLSSFGWIECVGLADRSAFDLTAHTEGSGVKLMARRLLDKPVTKDIVLYDINRALIGKTFKKNARTINQLLEKADQCTLLKMKTDMDSNGETIVGGFTLNKDMLKNMRTEKKTFQEEKYIPNVIEPSFGLGRIIYCLLEQTFEKRENDDKRTYFAFPPSLSTYKCVFLPLMAKPDLVKIVKELELKFRKNGIMCRTDCGSSALGKRYARTDEMGIPFAVTIDFDTLKDNCVTLREINSMKQIRLPMSDLKDVICEFIDNDSKFESLFGKYKVLETKE